MRQRVASGPGREDSTSFSLSIPCISMSMPSQPTLGSHSHHPFAIKLLQNRALLPIFLAASLCSAVLSIISVLHLSVLSLGPGTPKASLSCRDNHPSSLLLPSPCKSSLCGSPNDLFRHANQRVSFPIFIPQQRPILGKIRHEPLATTSKAPRHLALPCLHLSSQSC